MSAIHVCVVLAGSVVVALVFKCLRLPVWHLTGGVVGGAIVHLLLGVSIEMPNALSVSGQLLIGVGVGATIGADIFRHFVNFFIPGLLAVTSTIAFGLLFGFLFGYFGLLPPAESTLSLLPGGVGEMTAAAVSLDLDGAVVVGAHVIRLLAVMWSLPFFLWVAETLYKRWNGPPQGEVLPDGA